MNSQRFKRLGDVAAACVSMFFLFYAVSATLDHLRGKKKNDGKTYTFDQHFFPAVSIPVRTKSAKAEVMVQDTRSFKEGTWGHSNQAFIKGQGAGDFVEYDLSLKIEEAPQKQVKIETYFTRSYDYALVQPYVNGIKIGEPVDLWWDAISTTGPVRLGTVPSKRPLLIRFEFLERKTGIKSPMWQFGIDGIRVAPADGAAP